jgi:hypothetical protein
MFVKLLMVCESARSSMTRAVSKLIVYIIRRGVLRGDDLLKLHATWCVTGGICTWVVWMDRHSHWFDSRVKVFEERLKLRIMKPLQV